MTIEEKASAEAEKLRRLLLNCNKDVVDAMEPVIENVAWIKVKLDETRDKLRNASVAIAYDNGGGQKGLRESPLFKGYESLFKSYMSGLSKILEYAPKEAENIDKADKPKTVLELVRARHEA